MRAGLYARGRYDTNKVGRLQQAMAKAFAPCHVFGTTPYLDDAFLMQTLRQVRATAHVLCATVACADRQIRPASLLTCAEHASILDMAKMIQVRNVPDTVHRTLKARAALAGMSLSDFLLAEIRHVAERPSLEELRERLHRREPAKLKVSAAQAVREERDAR